MNSKDITSVLFVIDNLPFGGGERVFAQLIKGLNREIFDVHVACNPGGVFEEQLLQAGVVIEPVDMVSKYNVSTIARLIRIIKAKNIDIVHTQGARADFFGRIAARIARAPKIVSTVAMLIEGYDVGFMRKKIYLLFDRLTEKFVHRFLVVSDILRSRMINEHGLPSEKVIRIYNGIETDYYSPANTDQYLSKIRDELKLEKGTVLIGSIGRLVWQKGFEYLIESLPKVVKNFPSAHLLIVGDGPLKTNLMTAVKNLNLEKKVTFSDFRNDIKEILSAIDIVVVPSLLEGFPMITLEAMAMAKPIIATRIDGIIEQIIDGQSGILVPPKDPNSLADAIIRMIVDDNLKKEISADARIRVEKEFSVEKMISETEKVYSSLLS